MDEMGMGAQRLQKQGKKKRREVEGWGSVVGQGALESVWLLGCRAAQGRLCIHSHNALIQAQQGDDEGLGIKIKGEPQAAAGWMDGWMDRGSKLSASS